MNNRFEKRFAKLKERNEGAFMPFVTLCDPDKATSLDMGTDAMKFPVSERGTDHIPSFVKTYKGN